MALYLLVGLAWVLLGDELIEVFVDDPHLLTRYQTWKGWVYVIVTAVLAWWLLRLRSADAAAAHQAQQRLNLAAAVLDNTIEGVVVTDAQSRILSINPAGTRLLGYTEEELLGRNPRAFKSGRHDKAFYDAMWDTVRRTGHWRGEIWNQRKNGEVFPERMSMSALRGTDGVVTHYVCMFTDISQEKSQHQRLEFLAHFDPLTGLNNRAWFGEQLEEAVQQARATGEQMALLLLNLDRFKDVNDSYGHAVGDDVLKHITRQVGQSLRPGDLLGRLAGDEIAVLARHMRHADSAAAVAQHLIAAASKPWLTPEGIEVVVGVSAGICMFPEHAQSAELLLQGAHSAVYGAKARGRGAHCFFDESMIQAARERLELESRLRTAMVHGHLRLYYQPQVHIATGRIVGAEALLRWLDPAEGLISPARFIPVAETSGVIGPLGQWVIEEACRQGRLWRDAGLPRIRIAVNVSPRQFQLTDVAACCAQALQSCAQALQSSALPSDCLELELTESVLAQRPDEMRQVLQRLQALGVRIAVDDFGTGYSSLAHLKRFPIDVLKIDQGFTRDIPRSADDMAISAAIIAMGHSLGLTVLAEGVETPEQLAFLRERGCDDYQGYLCSRPVPPDEFARLLLAQAAA
ncbi:putative bifunctional diguanylate cyclase/phosphodiesterase [Diaphorobacter sp.]